MLSRTPGGSKSNLSLYATCVVAPTCGWYMLTTGFKSCAKRRDCAWFNSPPMPMGRCSSQPNMFVVQCVSQKMDKPELRGFVQKMLKCVSYDHFWNCRLVCKSWYEASKLVQDHWYNWLCLHGKQKMLFHAEFHLNWICGDFDSGRVCYNCKHYSHRARKPQLLKTVPLVNQVMRQMAKRKNKLLVKQLEAHVLHKRELESSLAYNRRHIDEKGRELNVLSDIEGVYQPKRKRTHIELNISK